MARIGFIGLGVMGSRIARHLAKAGHALTVYNRTVDKAQAWVAAHGGSVASSAAEAADGAEVVLTSVGNDYDLEETVLGPAGVFRTLPPGAIFADHTTVSARIARQIAVEGKDRGFRVLDAPVTGGQRGAEEGRLSVMCGGTKAAFEAAEPIFRAYAARVVHVGRAGAGQQTKMVNQIAIAGTIQSLAEALAFAKHARLDLDRVFEAVSGGAAASWWMLNRWENMDRGEFGGGLTVDWMRKDLGLALDEARSNGATLPLAALVEQFYADVQAMGGGKQDNTALIRRLVK